VLAALSPDSRLIAHRPFLEHLRDAGRARALAWLADHGRAVGRHSSADLHALFGHHAGHPATHQAVPAA
jgi:NTE family protein